MAAPSVPDKTADLLQRVRRLEIKTRELSRQMFSGGYHSAFKGKGMSFSEVREYVFGDDVRSIDWNVSARTQDPQVKVFEEEREISVMLLVDVSASTRFATRAGADGRLQLKQEWLAEIAAVLAFSAISNQDKVGAMLFSGQVEQLIPPNKGKNHVLRIIRELLTPVPGQQATDLADALRHMTNFLKKRSIVFVMSDFLQDPASYQDALSLARRRHDVVGIHLYDPLEAALPEVGLLRVKDPESGHSRVLDTGQEGLRLAYAEGFATRLAATKAAFQRSRADLLSLSLQDSYIPALLRFFAQRGSRK